MTDAALHIQQELLNHPRNQDIVYRPEPHTYHRIWDDGEQEEYYGVTSLLKKYAPFDAQSIKFGIVNSRKKKYAHLNSIEEVEAEWQAARDEGSRVHNELERWGETGEYVDDPAVRQAVAFFQKKQLTPIVFEHVVFCDTLKRATPLDVGLVNRWGQFVPADYKTSKTIKKSFYRYNGNENRMEYPLTHLPNSNFYQYSLQIGLAKHWIEQYYNPTFEIAPYGYIFHIRDGEFTPYVTLPMTSEIQSIYEWEEKMG